MQVSLGLPMAGAPFPGPFFSGCQELFWKLATSASSPPTYEFLTSLNEFSPAGNQSEETVSSAAQNPSQHNVETLGGEEEVSYNLTILSFIQEWRRE